VTLVRRPDGPRQTLKGKITGEGEILTHEETLRILSEMAQNGSVTATVALARELRLDPDDEDDDALDARTRPAPQPPG
jgi:hypothetical protein